MSIDRSGASALEEEVIGCGHQLEMTENGYYSL